MLVVIALICFFVGFVLGAWGGERSAARSRTEQVVEIGRCQKLYADRLKDAAAKLRGVADELWPAAWCDEEPATDQPDEPRGYE
jgi:hypothetical protein